MRRFPAPWFGPSPPFLRGEGKMNYAGITTVAVSVFRTPDADQTYFDFQVDQSVKIKIVRAPAYPEHLRASNIDGQVLVQFVVDERGVAEMSTFNVIKTTNSDFADAVRRATSNTAYVPAEFHGRRVKQLVQQPFTFNAHRMYASNATGRAEAVTPPPSPLRGIHTAM